MTWNLRYQIKSYIRSALWITPLFALLLEQVVGALAQTLDTRLAWKGLEFGVTGAQALLNAITTLTLSFIVFTFGSLLVAIQVASGQYTPRIIATTLFAEAEKAKGVIEFVPQVGDFVGSGEPLFLLHGGAEAVDERKLRACVVVGAERTIEQDPLFAFRILVDIAIKALSKAINDPTTAVLAIDQLHRLLRSAGTRNLRTDQILDRAGNLRVIFRTPNWEDFVHLAFSEIRFYGAENMQIARRLRAMTVNLTDTLPAQRHSALCKELELLDRAIERLYILPEDLKLARIPDSQGLGGSSHTEAAS